MVGQYNGLDLVRGTFNVTIRHLSFLLARAALRSFGGPLPTVFIMGHMRCGSSLLLHILLTNPEMIGCGERNAAYRSPDDFDKLEVAARIAQRTPFRRLRYAVDQINHDQFTPNLDLLRDERVRCIFLIRDPKETIQSIIGLTQTFYEPWTAQRATDYYSRRLQTLAHYAASVGSRDRALALTYNDLVADTPAALRRLESFLSLDRELREQYKIQRFTRKRGDPSETIRVGRIVRDRVSSSPVEIPDSEFARALHAYKDCARALRLELPADNPSKIQNAK